MIPEHRQQLNQISAKLLALLDNFKSLEGNAEIIEVFTEKLKIESTEENVLNQHIINATLKDLKRDLEDYKYIIKNLQKRVSEIK